MTDHIGEEEKSISKDGTTGCGWAGLQPTSRIN
jgi:hypothetical protein